MKISSISIKNYRSCIDTTFTPHAKLSVLIGPNGSGKTNVLSAIRLLSTLCGVSQRRMGLDESTTAACELKVVYDVDGVSATQHAKLSLTTNEKNLDEITTFDEYWTIPKFTGRKRLKITSTMLADNVRSQWEFPGRSIFRERTYFDHYFTLQGASSHALSVLHTIVTFVTKISYYSASQFTNPASCPLSFEVESDASRRVGISISGHKKFLFDMYQEYREQSASYSEFIDLVGSNGIGLIESIAFDEIKTSSSNYSVMTGGKVLRKERTNLLVVPSFKIAGNTLSPNQLSEGTFKTLALIFYLVADKSSALMIEEPEVCVHHGLLSSIVELVKRYSESKQIFISTHSDSLLDDIEVENVFKVQRTKERGSEVSSIKKKMGSKELAALRKYLLDDGSLGEYWKHGDLENV